MNEVLQGGCKYGEAAKVKAWHFKLLQDQVLKIRRNHVLGDVFHLFVHGHGFHPGSARRLQAFDEPPVPLAEQTMQGVPCSSTIQAVSEVLWHGFKDWPELLLK